MAFFTVFSVIAESREDIPLCYIIQNKDHKISQTVS